MATAASLSSGGRTNAFDTVATATTDSVLVAAVTGRKIRVHAVTLVQGTAAGTIRFNSKSGSAGTAISPTFSPAASTALTLPEGPGWFETLVGEGLSLTTGTTTTAVAVLVTYELVSV